MDVYVVRLGADGLEVLVLRRAIPVFAAVVPEGTMRLSREHDLAERLPIAMAGERLSWPRGRRALEDLNALLGDGDAGPLEDVLRVR